jgi:hypothetical protein
VRHGSRQFSAVAVTLGEGAQDRVPWRPSGGRSPWMLEEVLRRWGGTIPLVAPAAVDTAPRLADSASMRALEVRVSVGGPRGCWVALYRFDDSASSD